MTHFAFALVALLACARPASVQSIPVSRESGAPKSAIISDSHAGRVDPRQPAILFTQAKDEPARAVITDQAGNPPPTELPFGEAIYLSAIKSVKDGPVAWDIEPEDRASRAGYFEGGNVVCIPLGAPKQPYTLTVRQYVAKGGTPAFAKVKINIGGAPNPQPEPPKPPPEPPALTGIAKLSYDEAKKVNRQADCRKLAAAQGGIASAIRAGGLKEPADILTAWRDANRAAVDRMYWATWGVAMAKEWERLHSTGEAKTADDFAKVLDEVKRGLEAAGG